MFCGGNWSSFDVVVVSLICWQTALPIEKNLISGRTLPSAVVQFKCWSQVLVFVEVSQGSWVPSSVSFSSTMCVNLAQGRKTIHWWPNDGGRRVAGLVWSGLPRRIVLLELPREWFVVICDIDRVMTHFRSDWYEMCVCAAGDGNNNKRGEWQTNCLLVVTDRGHHHRRVHKVGGYFYQPQERTCGNLNQKCNFAWKRKKLCSVEYQIHNRREVTKRWHIRWIFLKSVKQIQRDVKFGKMSNLFGQFSGQVAGGEWWFIPPESGSKRHVFSFSKMYLFRAKNYSFPLNDQIPYRPFVFLHLTYLPMNFLH